MPTGEAETQMARRQVLLTFNTLASVLDVWRDQLSQSAILIPPEASDGGDLASEFRLDLALPLVGRQGPLICQVVQRIPDGSVAARIPEMPPRVVDILRGFEALFLEAKDLLIARGEVTPFDPAAATPQAERKGAPAPPAIDEAPPAESPPAEAPREPASSARMPARRAVRGYPLPALTGKTPRRQGKLDDRSLRGGLLDLAAESATGVLVVAGAGQPARTGYFSDGGLLGWRVEPVIEEETLGSLLVRSRQISEEQRQQAFALCEKHGTRMGETLVAHGVLPADQLAPALGRQIDFQLKQALISRPGEWSFYALDSLPDCDFGAPPLHVLSALHRALVNHAKTLNPRNVQAAIQPRLQLFPEIRAEYRAMVGRGSWTRVEQDLLLAIRRKPVKLVELLKLDPTGVEGPVAMLAWIELGVVLTHTVAPKSVAMGDEALAERIRSKRARVDSDNYFDILELHWISSAGDLDAAYEKMRNEFSRNAYVQLGAELLADVDHIAGQVQLAFNNLRDEVRRRRYRAEIIDPEMIARVAELLAERGEAAIAAKDRDQAIDCLAKAYELNPEERRFKDGLRRAQAMR